MRKQLLLRLPWKLYSLIIFVLHLVSHYTSTAALSMNHSPPNAKRQHLILIGGGHAHVQVIKSLNKFKRAEYVDVTLVDMQHAAVYSGMVPGCVAGLYKFEETLIKLEPLARWSGINFIQSKVTNVDPNTRTVTLNDGETLSYDVLSIDIGSASNGAQRLGSADIKTVIPTRPISSLVERIEQISKDDQDKKVVVVGGGVAGIELSMAIQTRLQCEVTIIDSKSDILPDESEHCRNAVKKQLQQRGIKVASKSRVEKISQDCVTLQNGEHIPHTHCLWATGAESHSLSLTLSKQGISCSPESNWIRVSPTMQTISHENIFAGGDCCTIEGLSDNKDPPPKAGVYAVRAGPILIENISKLLECYALSASGKDPKYKMKSYDPQNDFLKLIVCGDGSALGFRFGYPFYGNWVWHLKDYIDSKFMNMFDVSKLPDCSKQENIAHADCSNRNYDTSQYDDQLLVFDLNQISPTTASRLLQQTNNELSPDLAWSILRNMTMYPDYRDEVISQLNP